MKETMGVWGEEITKRKRGRGHNKSIIRIEVCVGVFS